VKQAIYIIITVIHCKESYFCISQGSAATLFRKDRWLYNYLWNFLRLWCTKIIEIGSVFTELL